MFDLFKNRPQDVKGIRSSLLNFIKEELQKTEGGEGGNIRGLSLFINCNDAEKHLYEAAVYADEENRFKIEEVQKIADDYALALPANWTMEILFTETVPSEAIKASDVDVALFISTRKKPSLHKQATAYIKVLHGEAERKVYTITSSQGIINIGREKQTQTADGFHRENFIAFPDSSSNESNRSVSRQHAHIQWDHEVGAFFLFADEGGVPPFNKIKVRRVGGQPVKLQAMEISHRLQEGDQVLLGESALIEFSYSGSET